MDQHQLGVLGGRALEQLDAGGDPRGDGPDLLGTGHLQAIRGHVIERFRLENPVQFGD